MATCLHESESLNNRDPSSSSSCPAPSSQRYKNWLLFDPKTKTPRDAQLGRGLVFDDETARIAGIADQGSRHPKQSRGSEGLSRAGLEGIGNLGETED